MVMSLSVASTFSWKPPDMVTSNTFLGILSQYLTILSKKKNFPNIQLELKGSVATDSGFSFPYLMLRGSQRGE